MRQLSQFLLTKPFLLLLLSMCGTLHASTEFGLSNHLQYFDYEEFELDGKSFNSEKGILPGIELSFRLKNDNSSHTFISSFYQADVDYDGQTQFGTPYKTKTGTKLYTLSYRLDYPIYTDKVFLHSQLNWDYWSREIKATQFVLGLDERYRWPSIDMGFGYSVFKTKKHNFIIEAAYSKIFEGDFEVDLSALGAGVQALDLGDGNGFKSTLSYTYVVNQSIHSAVKVFYKTWSFSRSTPKTFINGNNVITLVEPRSVSKRAGLAFKVSFLF